MTSLKFVMFSLSVRTEQHSSHWTASSNWTAQLTLNSTAPTERILMKIFIWVFFRKSVEKTQISVKSDKNNVTLHEKRVYILDEFFLEWEMFHTTIVDKIKTHILFSVGKSFRLWDNVGKFCRAGQATDGNMAHARCMLDS